MTSTAPVTSGILTVPDARLYYEVRGSGPLLALVGSPMDSGPFAPVADLLAAEYTVLTADPRGQARSELDDPDQDSTPESRADDLARLITHVDAGPAVVLGSSGGAVTALALTQSRPELVSTLIAHEPPLSELLDDSAAIHAAGAQMIATYQAGDTLGAFKQFFAIAKLHLPEPMLQEMFGGERDARALESDRRFFLHEFGPTTKWVPDTERLRQVPTEIVIGIGDESAGQLCDRTSRRLGTLLGIEPVLFPGGHGGFMEQPDAFAKKLREVLQDS
ncbi:alpha/beta fold hydrolase [Nocardia huaxiensis]|uniref:Alpha/beta hydrolase n=1 Tax=Nocardia huaxiensis TaxID=2755382 RepID=A0A7D6Z9Q1_9NOCA|nr:alpha/beta hydrolase [Nocardia huaxiensis]QLY28438.1 alpha/beta hydrolase [Nocardia huaxiensis]UFS98112.1 alpha/beta hydrolase [Nocardia huaxiensis]